MPNRRAGLAGAALALLALAGISCGGAPGAAPEEGREVAAGFLAEVRAGRIEPAWLATTTEFKSLMGLDSLRDYVRAHPALGGPAEFVEGHTTASGRGAAVIYTFRATAPARAKRARKARGVETVTVMTVREDGGWKVERLSSE